MEVISYENIKGIATVGFKEDNFVVYANVHFINGEAHERLLQRAYKEAKSAIEYERTQDEHAFVTDETGDEFIPDEPVAERIEIDRLEPIRFEKGQENATVDVSAAVYDQYGDEMEMAIDWTAGEGEITDNQLVINSPEEQKEITVTATAADLTEETMFNVYPYREPVVEPPQSNGNVAELTAIIDTMLGVEQNG